MKSEWLLPTVPEHQYTILAGDVGGTNTTLSLLTFSGGEGRSGKKTSSNNPFSIVYKAKWKTRKITDFHQPMSSFLTAIADEDSSILPSYCCISAAGPVKENRCTLTNAGWTIDGDKIASAFNLPTKVINDFTALSYSLPLLDVNNPSQISRIPHTDGSFPEARRAARAVIGAGTGMGFGFLLEDRGNYIAGQSEGGHMDFAPFDNETRRFAKFIQRRLGVHPGSEPCISGRGIAAIFDFFLEEKRVDSKDPVVQHISNTEDQEKPALISENRASHRGCGEIMRFFVKMYGKYAGNASLILLPYGGLFLAGGIVSKNEELFLNNPVFMEHFEQNYNPRMKPILNNIPVFIIREYDTSLYGAAHAAHILLQ